MARTELTGKQIKNQSVDLTLDVTGVLPVGNGGTGSDNLALNNVLLGNGTGALQAVAPGTSGNVLTSNGTTWVSAAPTGGGGAGDVTTNTTSSVDSELVLFSGTTGKELKRATGTGWAYVTAGVLSTATPTKSDVGLSNVDNTADADKPISDATQTALDGKADTGHSHAQSDITNLTTDLAGKQDTSEKGQAGGYASLDSGGKVPTSQLPLFGAVDSVNGQTGVVVLDKGDVGLDQVDNTADLDKPVSTATQTALDGKEPSVTAGTTSQYWRGDKSWQTLDKSAVGLSNVDDTSDTTKNSASATLTNKTISGADNTLSDIPQSAVTNLATDLAGKESTANRNAVGGYAGLDGSGKVAAAQLPSYVDDVIEGADLAAFPGTGETGKIYLALDSGKVYRWSGSAYIEISPSPGSTDSVTEGSTNLYYTDSRADGRIASAIGVSVQAYDADLTAFAAKTAPTGDVVGTTDTQTLSGKTISGSDNTLTDIGNAALTNSAITIAGTSTSLGDSISLDTLTGLSATGLVKRTGANTLAAAAAGTDYEDVIAAGTNSQYYRGDKSWQTLDAAAVSGVEATANKNQANGYAGLDSGGTLVPGYTIEAADLASFPATGTAGKVYVAQDTNYVYRWSGSAYVQIGGGATSGIGSTYSTLIGNGTATSITVTHNLGTRSVVVGIYDAVTYAEVDADVVLASADTITVTFGSAPDSNSILVTVIAGGGVATGTTSEAISWVNLLDVPQTTYSSLIGDGSATAIAVTHSLGTRAVVVGVFDAVTFAEIDADVVLTSANVATLTFGTAPASDSILVTVIAGGGVATGTPPVSWTAVTDKPAGQPGGYATLDSSGYIPLAQWGPQVLDGGSAASTTVDVIDGGTP